MSTSWTENTPFKNINNYILKQSLHPTRKYNFNDKLKLNILNLTSRDRRVKRFISGD